MTELSCPSPVMSSPGSVLGAVGNTPVLWVDEPLPSVRGGFWAKLEGFNPGGIKDRAALYMVDRARERGDLHPGAPIVESTSGTLGLGLALAGVLYGHPVHLVTDPGMEPIMERMLAAHGATLYTVDQPHPEGGWQEARRVKVAQLLAEHPGRGRRTNTTTPTTWPLTEGWRTSSTDSSVPSTSWSARSAPGATPRASPAACAAAHRVCALSLSTRSDPRSSGSLPAPVSCAVSAHRSTPATSTTGRSVRSTGSPPAKRSPRHGAWRPGSSPPVAGASGRSRWWRGGSLVRNPRHPDRRRLPRRTAPLLRHRFQRRLLPVPRPAERGRSRRARDHRELCRPRGGPMDALRPHH